MSQVLSPPAGLGPRALDRARGFQTVQTVKPPGYQTVMTVTGTTPSILRCGEFDLEFAGWCLLGQTPPARRARAAFAGLGRACQAIRKRRSSGRSPLSAPAAGR